MIKINAMRKYHKILSITMTSLLLAATIPVNGGTSLAKSAPAAFGAAEQFNLSSPLPLPFPFNKALSASASAFPAMAAAAASDFVYVTSSFTSFNDDNPERTFPAFTLPTTYVSRRAHIMVQAKGVDFTCNRFEINGKQVNVLVDRDNSNVLYTEYNDIASGTLRAGSNTLFVQTRNESCGLGGNLDDFAITNVVIFY
jgi:hypothetical protein